MSASARKRRCAIYTRKSTEEGLDQTFNTLDAQREACAAYIKSQSHEGWKPVPARYDDGGWSGGSLERPALQQLLADVRERRVDVIVVYKIDRLTRSLTDFARLAELFDEHGASFVSVTQQFNTTTSMGRLTLNVLLSFAQFEREIIGERIRDKIAASKRKGMWTGGAVPIGYDVRDKQLVVNEAEAETVRTLFRLYLEVGNVRSLSGEAARRGLRTKVRTGRDGIQRGGGRFHRGHLYWLLRNPVYVGRVRHKGQTHAGAHPPIIDGETWEAVQERLDANRAGEQRRRTDGRNNLLTGLLVDADGVQFTPTQTSKNGRRYRYYIERALVTGEAPSRAQARRIPAHEIEGVVVDAVMGLLMDHGRVLEAVGGAVDAAGAERVIAAAGTLHGALGDDEAGTRGSRIRPLLSRVVIGEGTVHVAVDPRALREALALPEIALADEAYEIVIPARVTMRGPRLKLVVGSGVDTGRAPDQVVVRVIARAHDWWSRLQSGEVGSLRELAESAGVTRPYVSQVLRLAFLAPEIVEAILRGEQPVELTAKGLLGRDIPLDWSEQRRRLGFPGREA